MNAFPSSWYIPQIISIGVPASASAAQPVGDLLEVGLDPHLPRVLAAATDDEVRLLGELAARVVLVHDRAVAVPPDPGREGAGVAEVAVDAHLARVEVHDVDDALAGVVGVGDARRACRLTRDGDVGYAAGLARAGS